MGSPCIRGGDTDTQKVFAVGERQQIITLGGQAGRLLQYGAVGDTSRLLSV